MKIPIIVGGVMLALGIAIGWVAKPLPKLTITQAVASAPAVRPPISPAKDSPAEVPGKRAIRPPEPAKADPISLPPAQKEQVQKMQEQMTKNIVARQRQKFENQIARLTESLALTDGQKAKLENWLDERMKAMETLDITDADSMGDMPEIANQLTNEALASQLDGTLTPEQQTALADFKESEHRNEVDSLALKSLAKLQGIIQFEDGQRDEVYKLLSESAEESIKNASKNPDLSSMFTEGMGLEMDPYDLGIQQAMTEAMTDPSAKKGVLGGNADFAKNIREVIDTRIEAKVEKLRPALNDRQLDAYRNELKTKGLGIYSTVLSTMESVPGAEADE